MNLPRRFRQKKMGRSIKRRLAPLQNVIPQQRPYRNCQSGRQRLLQSLLFQCRRRLPKPEPPCRRLLLLQRKMTKPRLEPIICPILFSRVSIRSEHVQLEQCYSTVWLSVPDYIDRPSAEEYSKLSSKEKRQMRNKISARNFRHRRKGSLFFIPAPIQPF